MLFCFSWLENILERFWIRLEVLDAGLGWQGALDLSEHSHTLCIRTPCHYSLLWLVIHWHRFLFRLRRELLNYSFTPDVHSFLRVRIMGVLRHVRVDIFWRLQWHRQELYNYCSFLFWTFDISAWMCLAPGTHEIFPFVLMRLFFLSRIHFKIEKFMLAFIRGQHCVVCDKRCRMGRFPLP